MKVKSAVAADASNRMTIRFKIDGLIPNHDGTFDLEDVLVTEVRWDEVGKILEAAGIDKVDTFRYMDQFAETVAQRELAKALAERMVRV